MEGIRHIRLDRSQSAPSTNPIFVGSVTTQEVVNEAIGELLRVTAVTFEDGAVNRPPYDGPGFGRHVGKRLRRD